MSIILRTLEFPVFDSRGALLGTFQTLETAHAWAHLESKMTSHVPIDIEDRLNRITRRVHPLSCELIYWQARTDIAGGCLLTVESEPIECESRDGGRMRDGRDAENDQPETVPLMVECEPRGCELALRYGTFAENVAIGAMGVPYGTVLVRSVDDGSSVTLVFTTRENRDV